MANSQKIQSFSVVMIVTETLSMRDTGPETCLFVSGVFMMSGFLVVLGKEAYESQGVDKGQNRKDIFFIMHGLSFVKK